MADVKSPVSGSLTSPPATGSQESPVLAESNVSGQVIQIVMPTVPPHVPPVPEESPPGGKFGIRQFVNKDGKRVETINWVNAHGLPYSDNPDENTKADLKDRRDLKGK